MDRVRVPCVGGIVRDAEGRLLLVRRGNEPARGCWSVPGGRVDGGESLQEATRREVLEETGLLVEVGSLVGTVEREAPDGAVYLIYDFACTPAADAHLDDVVAGDDATDVGWFTPQEMRGLDCSPGLLDTFAEWGVL